MRRASPEHSLTATTASTASAIARISAAGMSVPLASGLL